MRRTTFFVALALLLVLLGVACKNNAKQSKDSNELIMPTQTEIEAAKTTAKNLLPNFDFRRDEFSGADVYTHTNYFKFNHLGASIVGCIAEDKLTCFSLYITKNPIFHDCFYVKIDENVLNVKVFETKRKISGNYVSENIYPSPETCDTVLRSIAANPSKEVRVRLEGGNGRHDFTLNKVEQEAICETVELYDAMMLLRRAGIY